MDCAFWGSARCVLPGCAAGSSCGYVGCLHDLDCDERLASDYDCGCGYGYVCW